MGKRVVSFLRSTLPESLSKRLTLLAENVAFRVSPEYQGDTLPPMFHYWSKRYVRPKLALLEAQSPEDYYFKSIRELMVSRSPSTISVASFGAGAASLELELLRKLKSEGLSASLLCIDLNSQLQKRALAAAEASGVDDAFDFLVADCGRLDDAGCHDVLIVNQFMHHVDDVKGFCALLQRSLKPDGLLLSCDIIGRNGHVLWPSVDAKVQQHWRALRPEQQYDRYFRERRDRYISVNHAAYSNEGVRAQDIVSGLLLHFDFEVFLTYGAAIVPFVERRIGFNFDPNNADDKNLIDAIACDDETALDAGLYPASNMVAALRHKGRAQSSRYIPVSPEAHIGLTEAELAAVRSGTTA